MFCLIPDFVFNSMVTTYENEWDWGPAGRKKYNHVVAAVCKFTLNITDSPYTGMLKDGIQTGLIRISLVQDSGNQYIPAAAVKFLRSGVKSANFVALPYGLEDHTNNIFDPDYYPLTNHIGFVYYPEPTDTFNSFGTAKDLRSSQTKVKLLQGDDCLSVVGLSDMATYVYERRKRLEYNLFKFSTNLTIRTQ